MTMLKTTRWSLEDSLKTEEDMIAYLNVCLEEGDPAMVADAIGIIARKRGVAKIAKSAGINRENFYKTFSLKGNPEISTVLRVLRALGIGIGIKKKTRRKAVAA